MRGKIWIGLWGLVIWALAGCRADLPPEPLHIEVTGENYAWQFRYSGPDGSLQTADDICVPGPDLHLPVDWDIELEFTSRDYIYVFALPLLQLNQVAVPELAFELAFKTEVAGVFAFAGDQICGISHESLNGHLVVESPAAFVAWLGAR